MKPVCESQWCRDPECRRDHPCECRASRKRSHCESECDAVTEELYRTGELEPPHYSWCICVECSGGELCDEDRDIREYWASRSELFTPPIGHIIQTGDMQ